MPSNIAEAYESTLQRMLNQSSQRATLAIRVIGWIVHAERRLKVEELRHALAVEDGARCIDTENLTATNIILQVCIGLVYVDSDDNTVNMIHHTAYEYFLQLKDCITEVRLEIAKTCLTYLGYSPLYEGACRNFEDLRRRFNSLPLLGYAAHFWGYHVRLVEPQVNSLILEVLDDKALRSSLCQALQYRDFSSPILAAAVFDSLPRNLEPLHIAAYWNFNTIGEGFLLNGVNVNILDEQGWTALHWACSRGSEGIMDALLRHGADINARDLSGWTPLFWATVKGHEQITNKLLQIGANHILVDNNGWTVLQWAVSKGYATIQHMLLDHHAKLKAAQKPVEIWVKDISVEIAKKFSQSLVHRNDTITPLEIAAEEEDAEAFDTILEDLAMRGSSQNLNEVWAQKGWDAPRVSVPWRIMTKADYFDCKGLERWDINARESPSVYKTLLLHGAVRDGKTLIVQFLIELGVDLQEPYKGKTLLQQAALQESPEVAKILLANGANKFSTSEHEDEQLSPLHLAIACGFDRTAEALLQGGIDVNVRNGEEGGGENALMLACRISTSNKDAALESLPLTMLEMLIKYGADVCATNSRGENALHMAVGSTKPGINIIKLLLQNGVDVGAINASGFTPFHVFCKGFRQSTHLMDYNGEEILDLLLAHLPPGAENIECQEIGWNGDPGIRATPLAMALAAANWSVFHLLMAKKARFYTTQPLDDLLRMSAWCWSLQPKAVKLLLDLGASTTSKSYDQNPLSHEAIKGLFNGKETSASPFEDFKCIFDMYLDHGFDVNATNRDNQNLLHIAVTQRQETYLPALTQYLLDTGTDPYQPVCGAWDAFLLAAIHGQHQALRVLVSLAAKRPNLDHWLHPCSSLGRSSRQSHLRLPISRTFPRVRRPVRLNASPSSSQASKHICSIRSPRPLRKPPHHGSILLDAPPHSHVQRRP